MKRLAKRRTAFSAILCFSSQILASHHFLHRPTWLLLATEASFGELAGTILGTALSAVDWEHVVSPVVDHCEGLPEIDAGRLALLGLSFGGYLAPRAAAFEPRIRAVAAIDGLFDGHEAARGLLNDELKTLFDRHEVDAFNAAIRGAMRNDAALRWYIEQGVWSFRVTTPYEFFDRSRAYTLEGIAQRITCPVLVCQAAGEHFNPGQAEKLDAALGDRATVRSFTAAESAAYHSHIGAFVLMNGVVLDWIAQMLDRQTNHLKNGDRERHERLEAAICRVPAAPR